MTLREQKGCLHFHVERSGDALEPAREAVCVGCGLVFVAQDRCDYTHARDLEYMTELAAELEAVKTERDLAVLTLAAFTPADKPLPTLPNQFPSSAGVHTCHAECPCQHGGRPSPDFLTNEGANT